MHTVDSAMNLKSKRSCIVDLMGSGWLAISYVEALLKTDEDALSSQNVYDIHFTHFG